MILSHKLRLAGMALLLLSASSYAGWPAVTPFTAMAGSWSGGGTLTMASGMQEPLRCRAQYGVISDRNDLQLNIRCASPSYNFDLAGRAEYQDGVISGSWSEATRNASGTISGRASGNHIQVAARGNSFSASLSLMTRGRYQTVEIQPQGTDVTNVSIALNRR
ncbi:MAG TPA: hypothetical protein VKP67_12170 [Xanthobacteraceae bacterium]|nr:hypothetical protein [Xanthobacteraceae bacterium]